MADVPVLVLGAHATEQNVVEASRAGAHGFVVRPRSAEARAPYVARVPHREGDPRTKSDAHRMDAPRMAAPRPALTLVFPSGPPGPTLPSLHEHEGIFHARCRRCLRGSPPLGPYREVAEQRAIELGWAAGEDGWDCPVCIERSKTMRQPRPVLRRS